MLGLESGGRAGTMLARMPVWHGPRLPWSLGQTVRMPDIAHVTTVIVVTHRFTQTASKCPETMVAEIETLDVQGKCTV